MPPELHVSIRINPLPSEMHIEQMNELFKGEIAQFEQWFIQGQRDRGALEPTPLITAEHAILRGYLYYLCSKVAA